MSIHSIRTGAPTDTGGPGGVHSPGRGRPAAGERPLSLTPPSRPPAGEQAGLAAGLRQQQEGLSGRHCPPGRLPGTQEKAWFYKGRCQSQDVLIGGEHLLRAVHTIPRQAGDRDPAWERACGGGEVLPDPCPMPISVKALLPLKPQFPYLQNGANDRCLSCRVCEDYLTWGT